MQGLDAWIGRTETATARLDGWPLSGLRAALDDPRPAEEGAALPPTAHWLYFQPLAPQSRLGEDGHPERGGFLPPIELPRRMWAASEMTYHRPLCVGDLVEKRSRIAGANIKQGRTGALAFVTVEHAYLAGGMLLLSEKQTLVYRDAPAPDEPPHRVSVYQLVDTEMEDSRDLARVGDQWLFARDQADERLDPEGSHEGANRRQRTGHLNPVRADAHFFVGFTQRGPLEVTIAVFTHAPRERDLPGVFLQIGVTFGEDQLGIVRPVDDRD